jgi:hypothetical protein
MQKTSLYFVVGLLAALMVNAVGCKKVNGIYNNQVVETPYSLYYTDTAGALYLSNDGQNDNRVLFHPDGVASRAMMISGANLLWAKHNLYVSSNSGDNFNLAYDSVTHYKTVTVRGDTIDLNQSMFAHVPEWNLDFGPTSAKLNNYTGVTFSENAHGSAGSWWLDAYPAPLPSATVTPVPPPSGHFGQIQDVATNEFTVRMTSYAYMPDGTLCAYDAIHNRNFYRTKDVSWTEVTGRAGTYTYANYGDPAATTGEPLPAIYKTLYDPLVSPEIPGVDTAYYHFSYGHFNKMLIAICGKGNQGAWYSSDYGHIWAQYSGLPLDLPLYCIASPFEQICLIGSADGLYVLNINTGVWQKNNNGLASNLKVRNIAAKENFYKNGTSQKFIYLATSKGIYQSKDMGANWVLTIPGNFVTVY